MASWYYRLTINPETQLMFWGLGFESHQGSWRNLNSIKKLWNYDSTDDHETIVDCRKNPPGSLMSFREGNLPSLPGLACM